jgi:hypothetical protein
MNFRITQRAKLALFAFLGGCHGARIDASGPAPTANSPGLVVAAPPPSAQLPTDALPDGVERIYKGKIGDDLSVVVRLVRQGAALNGRYFYEKKGIDLMLTGALDARRFTLEERASIAGKISGRFEGTVEANSQLAGTWKDAQGQHPLPFRLEPVVPAWTAGSPVPLYQKHVHLVRKPELQGTSPLMKDCTFNASYPEVDGVFDPRIEAKINDKLHIKLAVPEPRCEQAESNELSYRVSLNSRGILSVVFDNDWCCGAHDAFSQVFVNLTVPDAQPLTLAGLLAPNARPKLAALARPLVAKLSDADLESNDIQEVLDQLTRDPADFSIDEKGLRLSAFNSQPHVIQSMFAEGFSIPFAKLRGILRTPGPLDAWLP